MGRHEKFHHPTKFLKHFDKKPNKIYGFFMLVYQAAPCFKMWFGTEPTIDEDLIKILDKKIL